MTFIDEHSDRFAVALLLRVLQIPTSTYYAWLRQAQQPCDRDLVDRGLLSNICDIWTASGCTYGADRVHRQLRRDGIQVGRKRVERLMADQGWQGAFLRRGWRGGSTRQDPKATPAPDLVNRNFTATAPNRLWVADATRIRCGEGMFWLAAVRDAFSNRIVGWKAGDRCDTDLILGALEYGIWTRDVRDQQLIHHSDYAESCVKPRNRGWPALGGLLCLVPRLNDLLFVATVRCVLCVAERRRSWTRRSQGSGRLLSRSCARPATWSRRLASTGSRSGR
ncbi:IS3 family transposase [Dactylosporangium sp. CA-152071]|uniref:IS3 family transposase n=1 Tax=Dactylosporangium sp. CA-152071 TaxID=3239933 RepID=UPI003D91E6FB